MKNNLHLTLSNIIQKQSDGMVSKIFESQNYLVDGIIVSSSVSPDVIYKCPKKTIHHSLVDFLPAVEFQSISEIKNYQEKHQDLIDSIIKQVNNLKPAIKDKKIVIKSVYKGNDSIALEAFPSGDILQFAKELAKSIKTVNDFPRVKGFPPQDPHKFAINVLRFFRTLNGDEGRSFIRKVEKLDQEIKEESIKFNLKNLSLVISDDYLSNPSPEIHRFNLS